MNNPYDLIYIAIEEAKKSLREGNSGFGAVVIKDNMLVSIAKRLLKIDQLRR